MYKSEENCLLNPDRFDEVRIKVIKDAHKRGLRSDNINSSSQLAPWLIEGIRCFERGITLTPEILKEIDERGGTTHPDPFV